MDTTACPVCNAMIPAGSPVCPKCGNKGVG